VAPGNSHRVDGGATLTTTLLRLDLALKGVLTYRVLTKIKVPTDAGGSPIVVL